MADVYGNPMRPMPSFPQFFSLKAFVGALMGLLAIPTVFGSFYTVAAESEGVLLRFGKFVRIVEPGLHFKIPLGVDDVVVLPTRRQLKMEFGFASQGFTNRFQVGKSPNDEKSMVTGDLNAALVEWVVQYRIDNAKEYLFDVRDPDLTLRDIAESSMREVVGDRSVDEVITIGRQEVEVAALARMQELSKLYQLGIRVDGVQLKDVNPPRQVESSFNEVNRAQQDRENAINIANGEYNKAVPRAKGQAEQTLSTAQGYRFKRINEAEGDVAAFKQTLEQYLKAPEITRTRIYLETMAEVLPKAGSKMIIDDSLSSLLPVLPLQMGSHSATGKAMEIR